MWQPSIKDEPFEELFVPEPAIYLRTEADDESSFKTCCLCLEGSKIQQKLLDHIHTSHNDDSDFRQDSFTCCFCEDGLRIQTELINHLLSHFTIKNEIECNSLTFESVVDINQLHPQDSVNDDPVEIRQSRCQKASNESKIQCNLCPKLFKYKQGVQKHWDLEHNPLNTFPCSMPGCSSRSKTLKNLHSHIRTHDSPKEGVASLQCHKCLKMFQTKKQLSLHLYTHREKFFCCDLCGSKFNNREQTKNHILRHAGLFQKKFTPQRIICDECSSLVLSHKMKRHKMIHHSQEKPFKCDFSGCSAAFSDNRILNDHKNIHLQIRPYKCEFCSDSFRSGANLRLHRIRHIDPNRHRCLECETSFVTKQALQKHNRKHTATDPEIRPFACEFPGCNSTFKQKDHVRNHVRRNHEKTNEVFTCTVENCTKTYDRKDALGKHMRKAHNVCKRKPRVLEETFS